MRESLDSLALPGLTMELLQDMCEDPEDPDQVNDAFESVVSRLKGELNNDDEENPPLPTKASIPKEWDCRNNQGLIDELRHLPYTDPEIGHWSLSFSTFGQMEPSTGELQWSIMVMASDPFFRDSGGLVRYFRFVNGMPTAMNLAYALYMAMAHPEQGESGSPLALCLAHRCRKIENFELVISFLTNIGVRFNLETRLAAEYEALRHNTDPEGYNF